MIRPLAIVALILLAACHRPKADQPTPGADGDARAQTAAKTLADLQAAADASQGAAPAIAPVSHHADPALTKAAPVAEETDLADNATSRLEEGNQAQ